MNNFSKTKHLLLVVISANVFAAAGYFFINQDFKAVRAETSQDYFDATVKEWQAAVAGKAKNRLLETQIPRSQVKSYFVAKDGVVDFIQVVEALAVGSDLSVETKSVGVSNLGDDKYFEQLKLDVLTEGSWAGTIKFLRLLQLMPYKIDLSQASVSNDNPEDKNPKWSGTFSLSVLKLK